MGGAVSFVRRVQQVAPLPRTCFTVATFHAAGLPDGETIAASLRQLLLDGLRQLGVTDPVLTSSIHGSFLSGRTAQPIHAARIERIVNGWLDGATSEARTAMDAGLIDIEIRAKAPVPGKDERSAAQLTALGIIDRLGLRYDEGDSLATVISVPNREGVHSVNVATVRKLIKLGDIERDGEPERWTVRVQDWSGHAPEWIDEERSGLQRWRLTEQGHDQLRRARSERAR